MNKEDYAEVLLDIGAFSINPTEPFKYASGVLSPVWIHARRITYFPKERRMVINGLVENAMEAIRKKDVSVVVGAGHAGISLATYVAQYLHLPMAYVRDKAKGHGKGKQIEGIVPKGSKALIVSDILSTEGHVENAVDALEGASCEVAFCSAIHSNQMGIVEPFLKKKGIPYSVLTDLDTVVNVAFVKKTLTREGREEIRKWQKDSAAWAGKRKKQIKKRQERHKKRIAEILLGIKAVSINTKKPFRYVSGIYSPIYTDNRLLISYPDEWKEVIDSCVDIVVEEIGLQNVDIIGGTATAGIPHAAYLAERLGLPMVYIKSRKDEKGKKIFEVEGKIPRNAKVLMMEDLISTGGSVLGSVDGVRDAGGKVSHAIAIFTYKMEAGLKAFKEKRVEIFTLSDINTLLDVAEEKKLIEAEDKKAVIEWTKDTKGWGKKRGFE
ncbi:MAG: hypothetical protein KAW41_02755 [Candidatus Diapherotrites archaeon]|nr:hypothetical protein [Candidatus Diapherotrites archaeon]